MGSEQTYLDDIKSQFEFLVTDLHYDIVAVADPFIKSDGSSSDRSVVYYRNEQAGLQIEIAGSGNWFHCELRRVVQGKPLPYSDALNSVGFETFAEIEKDHNHKNYVVLYAGWEQVLRNTANLIKRHKPFFVSGEWNDHDLLDRLKEYSLKNNFHFKPSQGKRKNDFFSKLKSEVAPLFEAEHFHLALDSAELPPFDTNGMVDFVQYRKDAETFTISQMDWRDFPFEYGIIKNGRKVFVVDLNKCASMEDGLRDLLDQLGRSLKD